MIVKILLTETVVTVWEAGTENYSLTTQYSTRL